MAVAKRGSEKEREVGLVQAVAAKDGGGASETDCEPVVIL